MPRVTKKELSLERNNPAAPFLFDEKNLPLRDDLLAIVQPTYKHTGARAMEDEKLALSIVEKLQAKWGLKKIADTVGVSKWTVKLFRDELVTQGKLAPFEKRLNAVREEILETGAEQYLEKLEAGFIPAAQIPLAHGIFADKRAAAGGMPTSIVGTVKIDPAHTVDAVNAYLDALPSAAADSQSGGSEGKPQ